MNVDHQSLGPQFVTLSESGDSDFTTKTRRELVSDGEIEIGNSTSEYTADNAVDGEASKIDDRRRELDSASEAWLESQSFDTDVELENPTSTKVPVSISSSSSDHQLTDATQSCPTGRGDSPQSEDRCTRSE
jgi:hypothetical protein